MVAKCYIFSVLTVFDVFALKLVEMVIYLFIFQSVPVISMK